jgi:hypothetical protein
MVRGSHNLQGQEIASMNKGGKCVRSNNQGSLNLQRTRNCSYEQILEAIKQDLKLRNIEKRITDNRILTDEEVDTAIEVLKSVVSNRLHRWNKNIIPLKFLLQRDAFYTLGEENRKVIPECLKQYWKSVNVEQSVEEVEIDGETQIIHNESIIAGWEVNKVSLIVIEFEIYWYLIKIL